MYCLCVSGVGTGRRRALLPCFPVSRERLHARLHYLELSRWFGLCNGVRDAVELLGILLLLYVTRTSYYSRSFACSFWTAICTDFTCARCQALPSSSPDQSAGIPSIVRHRFRFGALKQSSVTTHSLSGRLSLRRASLVRCIHGLPASPDVWSRRRSVRMALVSAQL